MSQFKISVCGTGCKDIAVPNTGFITDTNGYHGTNGETAGIVLFVVLMLLFGAIFTIYLLKRKKHHLVIDKTGFNLLPKKRVLFRIFSLVFVVGVISFVSSSQIQNYEKESFATTDREERDTELAM